VRLKIHLHRECHSAPHLLDDHRKSSSQEPTNPSNWIHSRPRKEVRGGPTYELDQILGEPSRNGLQGSAGPRA
jgi:hypothetical protein